MSETSSRRYEVATLLRSRVAAVALLAVLLGGLGSAHATGDGTTSGEPTITETSAGSGTTSSGEDGITPAGGGGGNVNNEVVVLNTTDGRFANRAGFGIAHVTGDSAENQNAAAATSSCTDCRTVAVAVQIVLIQRTDASNISPRNLAVAINNGCIRCDTFAAAYQYVITTDGLVRFTPAGQQRLRDLENQIRVLAATDGVPFPELEAQIDARVEQMWAVVDSELVKVGAGGNRTAYKDTDAETDDASPSPSATTAPSDETSTDTATPAEPTETPESEESPSPAPSPSESTPAPSESPEPSASP